MVKEKTTTEETKKPAFRAGFVTLVGRSNAGKSTLLNTLIGTKVAAVTHKPQTTRQAIHGVLNYDGAQAVFVDTPGVLKESHNPLSGKLLERVRESLDSIDVVIYVVDPGKAIGAEERYIMSLIRHLEIPKILVINKCDLPKKEKMFLDDYKLLAEDGEFTAVFELSALLGRHVEPLRKQVLELLPVGEAIYPPDQITNISRDTWLSEVIREKILLALRQEVPYTTHVEIESAEEKDDVVVIRAVIYTYDSRYKKMIIGSGGRSIKEIGIAARKEIATAINKKVFLELEVETDKHWEQRA